MKRTSLFACLFLLFCAYSCKKETASSFDKPQSLSFNDSAFEFLKANLSNDDFGKLDLSSGIALVYRKRNIGFKISDKGSSGDNFILLKRENSTFTANRVSLIDKKSLISSKHEGEINLEALDKKTSTRLIVSKNRIIQTIRSNSNGVVTDSLKKSSLSSREEKYELPEVVVTSYVYNVAGYYWSLYCLYSGGGGSEWLYSSAIDGSGSASNLSGDNVTALSFSIAPKTPIADIKDELKCFTIDASSSYTISVNVNQPWPNSRDKLDPTADFSVGHTTLTLQQTNSDGTQITRTIGFYPKNSVKAGTSPIDQSVFGDDNATPYAVSLQMSVSESELNTVINTIENQQSQNYDLNNFNCSTFAISTLQSIGINMPSTVSGDLIFFSGNNPADLGQDIRGLDLNDFSANNGNRKMVRTASKESNNLTPDPKSGAC